MTSRPRMLAALAAVTLLVTGCGGGGDTTLERADRAMGDLERGEIDLGVKAVAGQGDQATGPVGFTMAGRFDMGAGTALPVLDLTYTRLLGEEQRVVTMQSDGNRMVVTSDGVATDVPPEQAARLGLTSGNRPAGLGELGVSGWVTRPEEGAGPTVDGVTTRKVTGPVDAADLVSDLALLATQVSGEAQAASLDEEAQSRVRSRARAGQVEVLVDGDGMPRRVRATVDFGAAVPPELQQALGPYAGAALEVSLDVRQPGSPVAPPQLPPQ